MFFFNAIYWFWLFIVPTAVFGAVAIWLYLKSHDNLIYSIIIGIVGIVIGIAFAERIRRKYGLDNFFGRSQGNSTDLRERPGETNIEK